MTEPPRVSDVPRTDQQRLRDALVRGTPGIVQGGQQARPVQTGGNVGVGRRSDASLDMDPVIIGTGASANTSHGSAVGPGTQANGQRSVALGYGTSAGSYTDTAIGGAFTPTGTGGNNIGIGNSASTNGSSSIAVGTGATAHGDRSAAIGDSAFAANDDEMGIGSGNAIVIVNGKLVIADSSGGLHQIVVSTGGVLSTVAYP